MTYNILKLISKRMIFFYHNICAPDEKHRLVINIYELVQFRVKRDDM